VSAPDPKNPTAADGRRTGRRNFLRAGLGLAAGAIVARPLIVAAGGGTHRRRRIEITSDCVLCTGCIPVCPKDALWLTPIRLCVDEARCVLCGYCAAACPVTAIRLGRGESHD
jgi:ferredoxin